MFTFDEITRIIRPIKAALLNVSGRALLVGMDNTPKTPKAKVQLYQDEVYELDRLQEYGFESRPDETDTSNEAILHAPGGNKAFGFITMIHNRELRPKSLQPGEVIMYSKHGQSVLFKSDGSVIITPKSGQPVLLNGTGGNPVMLDTIIAKFNAHTHEYVAPLVPAPTAGVTTAANFGSGITHAFSSATDSAPNVKAKI